MWDERENDEADVLDRLVDGQLDDVAYRRLLLQLEAHPEGWRRCALAFLEAQAWRQEFRDLGEGSGDQDSVGPAVAPASIERFSPRRRVAEWLLALAVGLCIALPLSNQRWGAEPVQPSHPADRELAHQPADPPQPADRAEPGHPLGYRLQPAREFEGNRNDARPDDAWPGWALSNDVPSWPSWYPDWWLNQTVSAFPVELAQRLESTGNRLRSQRGLLPLETPDGQQVMIPFEQVEIIPVHLSQYR